MYSANILTKTVWLVFCIVIISCNDSTKKVLDPELVVSKATSLKAKADTVWGYIEGNEQLKWELVLELTKNEESPLTEKEQNLLKERVSELQKSTPCQECIKDIDKVDAYDIACDALIAELDSITRYANDEFITELMAQIKLYNGGELITTRAEYEESIYQYNSYLDSNLTFLKEKGFKKYSSFNPE